MAGTFDRRPGVHRAAGESFAALPLDFFSYPRSGSVKRSRVSEAACCGEFGGVSSPFDSLSEEILFLILDRLGPSPLDRKSFSLVCRAFHSAESRHRRTLAPLRSDLLAAALTRYPSVSRLDLSLCPRVSDASLAAIAAAPLRASLRALDLSRSRGFSHVGIELVVSNCSALVDIDLSNVTELNDAAAAAIGRARNLERLRLARCKMVTDMGIGCIAVGCQKLRLLCLKWCLGISDLGIGLVAVKCKQLRSLDLSYMPQITKKCLSGVLRLPHLEDLALVGCLGIDDDSFISLKQRCKSLEVLDIANCQHVTDAGCSSLLSNASDLQRLSLAYCCPLSDTLASNIQKLTKLHSVKLDGCHVTTTGLKIISNSCTSLRELSLSKCLGVTDEGLVSIVIKHTNLLKLDITCCRAITDMSLKSITNSCTSLTSLRMESCVLVSNEGLRLIGQHCHHLEELDLTDNDLDDEGLGSISKCLRLSSLKVGICLRISDEGLMPIGHCCPKLQELDLYRSIGITDKGVAAIARGCPMLQMINLSYCTGITDYALRSLSECIYLNTLEIRGCQVSNAGLASIAVGCRQLARLDIKKCSHINDAGIPPLARFSQNLRQINLSYSSITDRGLLSLASISCLQNMTVVHLEGLTPNGLAAALLACRGLNKVKLHSSFQSLIPKPLVEYIEARGCAFQWKDKNFQVEDDSSVIWKQRSQVIQCEET